MPQHQTASARGRKQNASRVRPRDRTTAISANGLLSRQFASITEVLSKASQRRNTELQERQPSLLIPVPTSRPVRELPVTPESELSQGSDAGDDRVDLEQVHQGSKGSVRDELMVAASVKGLSDMAETKICLRGGHVSDCADDPKMMLAELNSSKHKHSDSGVKDELDDNDDLAQILAAMNNISSSSKGTAFMRDNDPKAIPADLNMDREDDLSALARCLGVDSNEGEASDDAKAMLADRNEKKQASDTGHSEDEDHDLETFLGKMPTVFSPSCNIASPEVPQNANTSAAGMTRTSPQDTAGLLEPEEIPSAVPLKWEGGEDVKGWCTQLFSSGMNEWEDEKEKEELVKRENEKLDATIKYVLEEEKRYRAIEDERRLPSRLIVSNLAAGVDEEAIRKFFAKYKTEIRNVNLLSKRDPVKRTRTAYVDMYSRKVAVRASYEVGGIFGLIVKIKLAVE